MKPHPIDDRYVGTRLLLRDGSSATFVAKDQWLLREVVVTLHRHDDSCELGDFRRRAAAIVAAADDGHVPILDFGSDGQWSFAVYPLPRDTLAGRLGSGPLEVSVVRTLAVGLIGALRSLHDAGAAHGRITPGAIYLDEGAARIAVDAVEPPPPRWGDRSVWTATEQLTGSAATVRGDIWSLGSVLFTSLVGPGPGAIGDERRPCSSRGSQLTSDSGLMATIAASLLADPGVRPSSLDQVEQMLETDGASDEMLANTAGRRFVYRSRA